MSTKKILLTIVAVVLICAMSVAGTLAYLTDKTTAVTNTFISAGELADDLYLHEIKVVRTDIGNYVNVSDEDLGAFPMEHFTAETTEMNGWVDANTYEKLMPAQTMPKHARVAIENKNANVPAYLYIEVVDGTSEYVDWNLDSEEWILLTDVTGQNRGVVYAYDGNKDKDVDIVTTSVVADFNATITTDNTTSGITDSETTIQYYAYLTQASIGTPAQAYTTAFPAPAQG